MRSWQVIVASAVAATIVDALLFRTAGLPSRLDLAVLFLARWPAIAVVWLSLYGVAALVLTTLAVSREIGSITPRKGWANVARRYFVRLGVAQYFTSVVALLGFGLSHVPVETAPFLVLPDPIGGAPALAACGAVVVVGLLGGLFLTAAVVVLAERPERPPPAPGTRADRLFRDVVEPADAEIPAPAPASRAIDAAQLAELIQREQRPVLEALRDLAIAVGRLRRDLRQGLGEIKVALQDRRSEPPTGSGSVSPSAVEDAAAELRAAAAAVDASVARLGEMASLLAANEASAVAGRDPPISPSSRSRVSDELQELLRDLTPSAGRSDPTG